MSKNTMFEATYIAQQAITQICDMAWALEAGLWNLRTAAQKYYAESPNAKALEAKKALTHGLAHCRLNPRYIANELSWKYEQQYLAQTLLINAFAIFDGWVDNFVDSTISAEVLNEIISSKNSDNKSRTYHDRTQGDEIKDAFKKGIFQTYDDVLKNEKASMLCNCFNFIMKCPTDNHLKQLRLIYKYFKSCRNCCVHGNMRFTYIAEQNYKEIQNLSKDDCGLTEFPQIAFTKKDEPVKLVFRGVVGFFEVLKKIMIYYDLMAANKIAADNELVKRWKKGTYKAIENEVKARIDTVRYARKRNCSIRFYLNSIHMYAPYVEKTDVVYRFLLKNSIKI